MLQPAFIFSLLLTAEHKESGISHSHGISSPPASSLGSPCPSPFPTSFPPVFKPSQGAGRGAGRQTEQAKHSWSPVTRRVPLPKYTRHGPGRGMGTGWEARGGKSRLPIPFPASTSDSNRFQGPRGEEPASAAGTGCFPPPKTTGKPDPHGIAAGAGFPPPRGSGPRPGSSLNVQSM